MGGRAACTKGRVTEGSFAHYDPPFQYPRCKPARRLYGTGRLY
jgi:hypothetical protein